MSEQLIKQGLRRCMQCKKILALNRDNFYMLPSSRTGYDYDCIPCKAKRNRAYHDKKRGNVKRCDKCNHIL